MTEPVTEPSIELGYVGEVDRWHRERIDRLGAEDGWLTLVGLPWLAPGENRAGRGELCAVRYDGFPTSEVGVFTLDGEVISFRPAPGALVEGLPEDGVIISDAEGRVPTVLTVGTCTMHVISRGDRLGVRIKDSNATSRHEFAGVGRFPVDPSWRVVADYEPAVDATMLVELIIGTVSDETIAGRAVFELDGRPQRMVLMPTADPDRFYMVFGDTTNGEATYGGGRFLETKLSPDRGTVVLDFNRAYNPPCAFTPYATCPLPGEENRLAVPVQAGELKPQGH